MGAAVQRVTKVGKKRQTSSGSGSGGEKGKGIEEIRDKMSRPCDAMK
jgi:hypothetical protein